jgi:hypothetical protein
VREVGNQELRCFLGLAQFSSKARTVERWNPTYIQLYARAPIGRARGAAKRKIRTDDEFSWL